MGKINVLGFDIANLIAAGEVVDRPASVVKELCENSIDAGATAVTVEIKSGGVQYIRVSDNGCGIEADDLPMAVLRHATSKISTSEDLAAICTLGFRGEALAAIASVTHLEIMSKTAEGDFGTRLVCDGGEITDVSEAGCADGTTVIARDLFFNVPARRKFLKKDSTEGVAVTTVIEKLALSSPDVSFKYITDGEMKFATAGDGKLLNTIIALFGRDVAKRLCRVSREDGGIKIDGYTSEPDFVRSNRAMENFFINGRYAHVRTAAAALEQAYATRIASDKFPFCVLNIVISPEAVDVNVHPAKLEVKFSNERVIFEAVYYAVLSALEKTGERPEFSVKAVFEQQKKQQGALSAFVSGGKNEPKPQQESIADTQGTGGAFHSYQSNDYFTKPYSRPQSSSDGDKLPTQQNGVASHGQPECPAGLSPEENALACGDEKPAVPEYKIVGEAFNCYIIVELGEKLLMIDKHAAHERIIFDSMCRRMKAKKARSQMLLFPIKAIMSAQELAALGEFSEKIRSVGFEYKISGRYAEISAIPAEISYDAGADMLTALAAGLADSSASVGTVAEEFFEKALYQASCKAAIKGGRAYAPEHTKWLCDRILSEPGEDGAAIKVCPHGRPVAFEIKKSSIERQFKRQT